MSQSCGEASAGAEVFDGLNSEPSAPVRERPILFSAPMVRALLDGTKTQTRRIVKPQPSDYTPGPNVHEPKHPTAYFDAYCGKLKTAQNPRGQSGHWCWWTPDDRQGPDWIKCLYGVPGDLLWVRESHYLTDDGDNEDVIYAEAEAAVRDHLDLIAALRRTHPSSVWDRHAKLRPSIHMPRWASRITLRVTDVRVERLNEISEDDAVAEGAPRGGFDEDGRFYEDPAGPDRGTHTAGFAGLWEHINGRGSWDANPFVWVVAFEVLPTRSDGQGSLGKEDDE